MTLRVCRRGEKRKEKKKKKKVNLPSESTYYKMLKFVTPNV